MTARNRFYGIDSSNLFRRIGFKNFGRFFHWVIFACNRWIWTFFGNPASFGRLRTIQKMRNFPDTAITKRLPMKPEAQVAKIPGDPLFILPFGCANLKMISKKGM